ncbi:MAG: SRPBCC domain-containing protein, partial [Caldilineaceae bacterium]
MTLSSEELGSSHHADAVAHLLDAPPERTYTLRRHLDAPPALVWQVWTDPAQVPHWWGPTGATFVAEQMDLCPGGVWQITQTEPP